MAGFFKFLLGLALFVALLAIAIGGLVVGGTAALVYEAVEEAGGIAYLADPAVERLVDRLTEDGFGHRPLDAQDPLLKRRIIVVTEAINERTARYVVERIAHLDALNSKAPITLQLSTSGGWLDAAFAIVDTMRAAKAPVHVTATGGCYSAGTVILAAATGERIAMPSTLLSVHVNEYYPGGEHDYDALELERFRTLYERYTRIPSEWFDKPGDNHYYLDAEEALRYGLVDKIAKPNWAPPAKREEPAQAPTI